METNVRYHGDNLDILRRYIQAERVDLVYLDPPFNSNRTFSAIFAAPASAARLSAALAGGVGDHAGLSFR